MIITTIIKMITLRLFKTKNFDRFQRKERLKDDDLVDALREMERGLVDAELGGGVYKKRVRSPGKGKSGSYRTLLAVKYNDRAIFMYGYPKNTVKKSGKEITDKELSALKDMAKILFEIDLESNGNSLIEVKYE